MLVLRFTLLHFARNCVLWHVATSRLACTSPVHLQLKRSTTLTNSMLQVDTWPLSLRKRAWLDSPGFLPRFLQEDPPPDFPAMKLQVPWCCRRTIAKQEQCESMSIKAMKSNAKQSKAQQIKVRSMLLKAEQSRAEQSNAKQSQAKQLNALQSGTMQYEPLQNNAKQS